MNDQAKLPDVLDLALLHKPAPPDAAPAAHPPRRAPNPWMDDPPPSATTLFWNYMAFLGPPAGRIGLGEKLRNLLRDGRYADAFVLALWVDHNHPAAERPAQPPLIPGAAYREPTPCTKEIDDAPPASVKTGVERRGWREAG